MSMDIVPADVLLEIADYLSCPSEILHLYLTVRANNTPSPKRNANQPIRCLYFSLQG
jgi:hypothetical protein